MACMTCLDPDLALDVTVTLLFCFYTALVHLQAVRVRSATGELT